MVFIIKPRIQNIKVIINVFNRLFLWINDNLFKGKSFNQLSSVYRRSTKTFRHLDPLYLRFKYENHDTQRSVRRWLDCPFSPFQSKFALLPIYIILNMKTMLSNDWFENWLLDCPFFSCFRSKFDFLPNRYIYIYAIWILILPAISINRWWAPWAPYYTYIQLVKTNRALTYTYNQ